MAKLPSKTQRILDILAAAGEKGMRFTDIQRALWVMTHGKRPFTRDLRGYWCTNLLGGMHYHRGILRFYCAKGADGLWRRNAQPHHGTPWKTMFGGEGRW